MSAYANQDYFDLSNQIILPLVTKKHKSGWPSAAWPYLERARAIPPCETSKAARMDGSFFTMATATTTRVDWKLIWAQPGFRYFFLAMFVSLFGSGMNFV